MTGEECGHAPAARIDHHDLHCRLLLKQRLDRVNGLLRRAQGDDNDRELEWLRLQGLERNRSSPLEQDLHPVDHRIAHVVEGLHAPRRIDAGKFLKCMVRGNANTVLVRE